MLYIFTTLLYLGGSVLWAMKAIKNLKKKYPLLKPKEIISTFYYEEWDTVITNIVIWLIAETMLYIWVDHLKLEIPLTYMIGLFLFFLVLGYAGIRLAYKFMGTTENILNKKMESINDSNG